MKVNEIVGQINFAFVFHRTGILLEIPHYTLTGQNMFKTSFSKMILNCCVRAIACNCLKWKCHLLWVKLIASFRIHWDVSQELFPSYS